MEKVIVLKGAENRGKTSTLRLLIELLLSRGATIVHNDGYTTDIKHDCFVILDVPDFGPVGVITYGDKGSEQNVLDALQVCLNHACRAVISASHMQYKTPQTVYKILWDFGKNQNAKTVETTTIMKFSGWGQPIPDAHVNRICADNLINLLLNL